MLCFWIILHRSLYLEKDIIKLNYAWVTLLNLLLQRTHSLVNVKLLDEQRLNFSLQYFDFFPSRTSTRSRHPYPCPPPSWGKQRWPHTMFCLIMFSFIGQSLKTGGGLLASNPVQKKKTHKSWHSIMFSWVMFPFIEQSPKTGGGVLTSKAVTAPTPTTPASTNDKDYGHDIGVTCGGHQALSCHQCPDRAPSRDTRYLWKDFIQIVISLHCMKRAQKALNWIPSHEKSLFQGGPS